MSNKHDNKSQDHNKRDQNKNNSSFSTPYNFVPINKDVLIPWWYDIASQDCPFENGESGKLTFKIKSLTPLFIRDGSTSGQKSDYSANVMTPEGRRFFIPGSTLRGMIRNVAEILSFSRLSQYNDDYFGYRDFGGNKTKSTKSKTMKNVSCGWIRMKNESLYLTPCGTPEKFELSGTEYLEKLQEEKRILDVIEAGKKLRYQKIGNKRLVCNFERGYRGYLFNDAGTGNEFKLDESIKNGFLTVYEPDMRKGERLPVFYIEDNDKKNNDKKNNDKKNTVIIRLTNKISNCVKQNYYSDDLGYKFKGDSKYDMCETLFGHIDKDKKGFDLKGRVWIEAAFCDDDIPDEEMILKRDVVLGSPKSSFYPLYLKQNLKDKDKYATYDDIGKAPEVAGRKRYRIHSDKYLTDFPKGNDNNNVMTSFYLLPKGKTFTMSVRFHNLLPEEIGLLMSAITFHNDKSAHHNIGLAKSFGYGKIGISLTDISGLDHNDDYYMEYFERYINTFTSYSKLINKKWSETEQVRKLFAIAYDHDSRLEMMDLQGYKYAKKIKNKKKFLEDCNVDETGTCKKVRSYIKDYETTSLIVNEDDEIPGTELHNRLQKFMQEKYHAK